MLPPELNQKYEVRGTLGAGAMGTVYDAVDRIIERRVAIKVVNRPAENDPEAVEAHARFRREAQAAGRLSHPNIVGVYDYGENQTQAWIVMELVEGGSLKGRLDKHERFPVPEIVRIMAEVCAGLQYSHQRGVVHRDIKPGNIMMTPDGQVKIADFGIARLENSSMTQVGTLIGTPSYMAPEQFRGEPVDLRADIWASGVMLYQLLTGEKPFEGGFSAVMHKALHTEPPPPSQLSVTTPRGFDAVIARALAKRPEDRFGSAAEFAEAIRAAVTAQPAAPAAVPGLPGLNEDATIVSARPPASGPPQPRPPGGSPAVPRWPRRAGRPDRWRRGRPGDRRGGRMVLPDRAGRGARPDDCRARAPGADRPRRRRAGTAGATRAGNGRPRGRGARAGHHRRPGAAPGRGRGAGGARRRRTGARGRRGAAPGRGAGPHGAGARDRRGGSAPRRRARGRGTRPGGPRAGAARAHRCRAGGAGGRGTRPHRARAAGPTAGRARAGRARAAGATPRSSVREAAERERLAREAAERERLAREASERERLAREAAERDRLARDQAARQQAERLAREQAERDQLAREEAARQQAERDRLAREQAERDRLARLDMRAAAQAIAFSTPCSLIAWSATDRTLTLTGVVRRGDEPGVRAALAQRGVPEDAARLTLTPFDGAFCDALDLLRPLLGPPGAAPMVSVVGRLPLQKDELMRLDVHMPDWPAHLYVAYFMHSGEVANLVPSALQEAGAQIRLGEPQGNFPGWIVDEPYGTDLAVVIASDRPLFGATRPVVESQADYVSALAAALRNARATGTRVIVRPVVVETVARR
jgi:hypothetical protein